MGTITDSASNVIISYAYFMDTQIFINGMAYTYFVKKIHCIFSPVNCFNLIDHKGHTQKIFEQLLGKLNMMFYIYIFCSTIKYGKCVFRISHLIRIHIVLICSKINDYN